jgi:DNA (cytosine-5)-methyltransferase 1
MLENVEEFQEWGPLLGNGMPCPRRAAKTFHQFVANLRNLGYQVEYRELRARDYGAPTTRKRLFLVARCDERPIVWPEATHGDPGSREVLSVRKAPWLTTDRCVDWSLSSPSIFGRKRPLVESTCRRIAKGILRYAINTENPLVSPSGTLAHVTKFRSGSVGHPINEPLHTITANSFIKRPGGSVPLGLVEVSFTPISEVDDSCDRTDLASAFLSKYLGVDSIPPIIIAGIPCRITDIGMRMFLPRELFLAQGFPASYLIDMDSDGAAFTKTTQIRMVGNSVCPPMAAALVAANVPELSVLYQQVAA